MKNKYNFKTTHETRCAGLADVLIITYPYEYFATVYLITVCVCARTGSTIRTVGRSTADRFVRRRTGNNFLYSVLGTRTNKYHSRNNRENPMRGQVNNLNISIKKKNCRGI